MTLFRNQTHRGLWRERWCETCFQPDEAARRLQGKDTVCPIWAKAMNTDRKPVEWDRNNRTDEAWKTIRCNAYQSRPAQVRKNPQQAKQFQDVSMFDTDKLSELKYNGPYQIPGWPQRPEKGGVDHA